jgi:DNA-binding GntR family transcriptional regulator
LRQEPALRASYFKITTEIRDNTVKAIESGWGIKITDVKHLIGAKLVDAEISAHLQIPAGSPVLFVERYFCRKLVLRTMGYYRRDLFRNELKLKRGAVKPSLSRWRISC